jgi:hypothetical protein
MALPKGTDMLIASKMSVGEPMSFLTIEHLTMMLFTVLPFGVKVERMD